MTEWFEQWFGEEYLTLYPHRDAEDARRLLELVTQHVTLPGRRVLDMACGAGRHAQQLAAAGARVVGFDLSMPLLSRAKHRAGPLLLLVRGDMRQLPFREGSFDVVVNLFTSFGYFAHDHQHAAVLAGAARVLREGGTFVLDYLNAARVRHDLVPHEEQTVGEQRIAIDRRISDDGAYVFKEIHLVDDGRSFLERVRLFAPEELERLLAEQHLIVDQRFGDYTGATLDGNAPRAILIARRQ